MTHYHDKREPEETDRTERGHAHWLMIACCIPMLVVAVALVATGIVGPGFIVAALMCVAMMALMMRGMSHGDGGGDDSRDADHDR